jgi:hypothetical protein
MRCPETRVVWRSESAIHEDAARTRSARVASSMESMGWTESTMISGGCLCGEVRFEVTGAVVELANCHCSQCRKAYGAAFGTVAVVERKHFAYVRGEERVRRFQQTPRVNRYFCGDCGSPLPMVEDWDPLVGIPAGVLDDDPGVRISSHIFVDSKAAWWTITDALPQHAEYPPGEDMNERAAVLKGPDRQDETRKS